MFWHVGPAGLTVRVKVQPKSRRPGLQGKAPSITGPRLRIGVTSAASDGEATRAACEMLAEALEIPGSAVRVLHGATSREKVLTLSGEPTILIERLAAL